MDAPATTSRQITLRRRGDKPPRLIQTSRAAMVAFIRHPLECPVIAAPALTSLPRAQTTPTRWAATALTPYPLSRCAGEGERRPNTRLSPGVRIRPSVAPPVSAAIRRPACFRSFTTNLPGWHADTSTSPKRRRAHKRRFPYLLALLLLTPPVVVSAQAATPEPTRDAPPPALCRAAPRSLDDLDGLSITPATAGTAATPRPRDVVPQGTPADPATVAGVTATVRELVACFNAGELLRVYGLYTDPYLHRLLKRQDPMTLLAYDALATPMPEPPASRAAILAIRDVRLLPDGTAGATVTIQYAVVPMPKTFFIVFARAGNRWLIADILGEISFSVP